MKRKLTLLFCLLIFFISSMARELHFNATADRLFSDSAYHDIIRQQCEVYAKQRSTRADFESNYSAISDTLIALSSALIEKKFNELEQKISKQKIKDHLAIQLYEKSLANAVSVTLSQNNFLQRALLKKNGNDRIISFDSKIQIDLQGLVTVTETILIANHNDASGEFNNSIQRGITRDFPTQYETKNGFISKVPFHLISVTRNGDQENFRTETLRNGIRIYCGRKEYLLPEGLHKYVIRYTTANQLKFHNNRDEFYWNVTGNGWDFSIGKATCDIEFPSQASLFDLNCYTGFQGEQQRYCDLEEKSKNSVHFQTSNGLKPSQGLTVSVSVKKGLFVAPDTTAQLTGFAKDNRFILTLFLLIFAHFIILLRYWRRVGKDPKEGVIIPTFTPPGNLSPAAAGFIYFQEYNNKLLSAAIIDLAVRKKVHIEVDKEGLIFKSNVYKFSKPAELTGNGTDRDYDMYGQYGFDADELYGIEIQKGTYNASFADINRRFKNHISGKILSAKSNQGVTGFLSLNDGYIGAGVFFLVACIFASIIYLKIFGFTTGIIIYTALLILIGIIVQIIFMRIIKAYSPEGRSMADKVLGFKMYLETTEKHIFDHMNPPEENIQLFEKYLPFAIALGIENKWSDKFKSIIAQSFENGYQPTYYSLGSHNSFSGSSQSFASDFSSGLSNTVSSASTPPSSSGSSGSGGGGFSGGGGGGGGGGGW